MGLLLSLCALRRVGVVAVALLGGVSMTPVSAQYREQRITTAQGTYVLRSDADDDERMEGWSSSLMAHRPDGTELLFAEVGLVVGCWEFTPQVVQVKGRAGRQISVVLLCGTPGGGGRYETLIALRDGTGEFDQLDGGEENMVPYVAPDGRLIGTVLVRQDVPGISWLVEVPMQFELNVDRSPIRFEPVKGDLIAPRVAEILEAKRKRLLSHHAAEDYFASAHAALGERACAHLHKDLPGLWKLLGDAELAALNRWITTRFSLKECTRHATHQ